MKILIECNSVIPVKKYGGTQRVLWYLGKELVKLGHDVTFLAKPGSSCDFASIIHLDPQKTMESQIPDNFDIVHFNTFIPPVPVGISKPYITTIHTNEMNKDLVFSQNSVFVSKNHANRYNSDTFVYNGLDWDDYGMPDLQKERDYFHFLGKASWRLKNVKGAIQCIQKTKKEKIHILGGTRLNFKMGFRFTTSQRARFYGMVGGEEKNNQLANSKGLVFPVLWNEPFGLAITESLFMGCPVFATPYGSISELVNSEVGYLSNDSDLLAQAIENSEQFSRKLCHEYARDNFNSKKMALSYLNIYERVLNGEVLNDKMPKLLEFPPKFLDWK